MKLYYTTDGVGSAKYTVSSHDGVQTHRDGSPFYDIAIFRNKRKRDAYIKGLVAKGYRERGFNENVKRITVEQIERIVKQTLSESETGGYDIDLNYEYVNKIIFLINNLKGLDTSSNISNYVYDESDIAEIKYKLKNYRKMLSAVMKEYARELDSKI